MKIHVKLLVSSALLSLTVATNSVSQDNEEAAKILKLRDQFNEAIEQLDKPLNDFKQKYRGYLTKQKAAYQAKGQLEALLAVEQEMQQLDKRGDLQLSNYPELNRLQKIYREERDELLASRSALALKLANGYHRQCIEVISRMDQGREDRRGSSGA